MCGVATSAHGDARADLREACAHESCVTRILKKSGKAEILLGPGVHSAQVSETPVSRLDEKASKAFDSRFKYTVALPTADVLPHGTPREQPQQHVHEPPALRRPLERRLLSSGIGGGDAQSSSRRSSLKRTPTSGAAGKSIFPAPFASPAPPPTLTLTVAAEWFTEMSPPNKSRASIETAVVSRRNTRDVSTAS